MLYLLSHGPHGSDPGPAAWVLLRYLPAALWGLILSGPGQDTDAPPEVCLAPSWPGPVSADALLLLGERFLPVVAGQADAARLVQVALAARRGPPGPASILSGLLHISADASPPEATLAAARDRLGGIGAGATVPLFWLSWADLGAAVRSFLPRLQGGERLAAEDLLRLLRAAGVLGFSGFAPLPASTDRPPWRYAPQARSRYFQGAPSPPAGAALFRYAPAPYFAAARRPPGPIWRYH